MVICDIDGTVADASRRAMKAFGTNDFTGKHSDKEWDEFFDPNEMIEDEPIKFSLECIHKLSESHAIVMLTGRLEKRRHVTKEWLNKYKVNHTMLLMRPNDMIRDGSTSVKKFLYKQIHGLFPDDRIIAFDDDERALKMYRTYGITTMVAPQCWEPLWLRLKSE